MQPPSAIFSAVTRLFRPLLRLLIEHGITYPQLSAILKATYVQVADRHFALPEKPQTDSRISVLTGVHRKDVRRLRGDDGSSAPVPETVSQGARLVSLWVALPDYCDGDGQPKPLPRQASAPDEVSFDTLASSLSKDVRPRALLDELVRLGVAVIDKNDRVHLKKAAFIPASGIEEKTHYLGRNVGDHIAAAVDNLQGSKAPFLERSVYYDGLTEASVQELTQLSEKLAMDLLRKINRRAHTLAERDESRHGAHLRMNLGVYFYSAEAGDGTEENDDAAY